MKNKWEKTKQYGKKTWHFIWHDDSAGSWIANIIIAFLIIRFLVYPLLGVIFGTSFPIVAVISESMEHGLHNQQICGQTLEEFQESFDNYWQQCGQWYEEHNITKEQFQKFPLKKGFRKGDIIIIWRSTSKNTDIGDVLVFQGNKPQPIIHRVVNKWEEETTYYQTKGDHNAGSITGNFGETKINQQRIYGKGILRVPYFGYIKILFVDAVKPLGINIQR